MPSTDVTQIINAENIMRRIGVREAMHVADLGCGAQAHFVFPAAKFVGASGKVYAVDIQKPILANVNARARELNVANVETVWTDLEVYGAAKAIGDGALDIAFLFNTLFQSQKKEAIIKEALRMLKKGGTLAVIEWTPADAPLGPAKELRVPEETVRRLASQYGLTEVAAFDPGPYHYGIVFRK